MAREKIEHREIDVVNNEKRKEHAANAIDIWFNDHVGHDKDRLITEQIRDLTIEKISEQFTLDFEDTKSSDGKSSKYKNIIPLIYYLTHESIMEWLQEKQATHRQMSIEIGQSINIGYVMDDADLESAAIQGFIELTDNTNKVITNPVTNGNDKLDDISCNLLRWTQLNTKQNANVLSAISINTFKKLIAPPFNLTIPSEQCIIPIYCIFNDTIISKLDFTFKESEGRDESQVSFNIMGLYEIFYICDSDVPRIEYKLDISNKLGLKSNKHANPDA